MGGLQEFSIHPKTFQNTLQLVWGCLMLPGLQRALKLSQEFVLNKGT